MAEVMGKAEDESAAMKVVCTTAFGRVLGTRTGRARDHYIIPYRVRQGRLELNRRFPRTAEVARKVLNFQPALT